MTAQRVRLQKVISSKDWRGVQQLFFPAPLSNGIGRIKRAFKVREDLSLFFKIIHLDLALKSGVQCVEGSNFTKAPRSESLPASSP